jgi:FKBP-type peptidyl-prolyl cis-trans isomerase
MGIRVTLLLGATVAFVTACVGIDPIATPQCTVGDVTPASASADTITTTSGLRYLDGAPGDGSPVPWCRSLVVDYTGYLLDGTEFDSSHDIGHPLVFTPGYGAVIDGFEQGVIGMRPCGTRRLIIPPALGYGDEARRNEAGEIIIPPNSTVVFDVKVLEILGDVVVPWDTL